MPAMTPWVMSGRGGGGRGLQRGVRASAGGGDGGGGDEKHNGLVVGAEGAFPVEIGFTDERSEGAGVERIMTHKKEADHREGAATATAGKVAHEVASSGASGKSPDRQKLQEGSSFSSIGEQQSGDMTAEDEEGVSSLGSWAADFGLFVSEDGTGIAGGDTSDGGIVEHNPLAGWGEFEENTAMTTPGKEEGGVGGYGAPKVVVRSTDVGANGAGATGADTASAQAREHVQGDHKIPAKEGGANGAGTGHEMPVEHPNSGGGLQPAAKPSAKVATGANVDGDTSDEADDVVSRFRDQKKLRSPSFFSGLRNLGGDRGDRDTAKLEASARVAGGELYGLADRLSILSSLLAEDPLCTSGKGAASVSAAVEEVESLRNLLKTGEYRIRWDRPGDVRRAVKAAERRVRDAERTVQKDLELLNDAGECLHDVGESPTGLIVGDSNHKRSFG